MISEGRLFSIAAGQPVAGLWGSVAAVVSNGDPVRSSCHVWEAVTADLRFLCLCLGWPATEQSATCLGFVCSPLSRCFLGVTCAFVLRGGEPCGLRDAYSCTDYMFCVSSCLSKPAPQCNSQNTDEREKGNSERQISSFNGKHTEHFFWNRTLSSFFFFLFLFVN